MDYKTSGQRLSAPSGGFVVSFASDINITQLLGLLL